MDKLTHFLSRNKGAGQSSKVRKYPPNPLFDNANEPLICYCDHLYNHLTFEQMSLNPSRLVSHTTPVDAKEELRIAGRSFGAFSHWSDVGHHYIGGHRRPIKIR